MEDSSTRAEREMRVNVVLNDLNLTKCQETLIGNPLLNVKGISGE